MTSDKKKSYELDHRYSPYLKRIESAYNEIISEIVNDCKKFTLSPPIACDVVRRFLQDMELIEECHSKLEGTDAFKVAGYLTYWLTKLRPIQIMEDKPTVEELYVNEYLALSIGISIIYENKGVDIWSDGLINDLMYLLKYRTLTLRTVPMIYGAYSSGYRNGQASRKNKSDVSLYKLL